MARGTHQVRESSPQTIERGFRSAAIEEIGLAVAKLDNVVSQLTRELLDLREAVNDEERTRTVHLTLSNICNRSSMSEAGCVSPW